MLSKQWHPSKNGDLTPDKIVAGSSMKVWWKCDKGPDHEWQTSPSLRINQNTSCPFCSNKRVSITNSLAVLYPHIAEEWHPSKNDGLTPEKIVASSEKKVWWKCKNFQEHEWQVSVYSRTKNNSGCPFCARVKTHFLSSIFVKFPSLKKYWHPKNRNNPKYLGSGSRKKVWWKCDKGPDHEWEASPIDQLNRKEICPFCSGKRLSITNSLATLFPEVAREWHPTKNGDLTPDKVRSNSMKSIWWKCDKGPDHEWQTRILHRTGKSKSGCPFCANKKVSVTNSLATLFPEIAKEWHPSKNGDLTPDKIVTGSSMKVWWKCNKGLDHEWEVAPGNRILNNKKIRGCPFCANQKVSITNSLATRFPEIAKEWHPIKNGNLTPDDIIAGSRKKVWWICEDNPEHEWQATLDARTGKKGTGCPFCKKFKFLDNQSLATKYPELAKQWHPTKNGELTPNDFPPRTRIKVWWMCDKGSDHEWKTSPSTRIRKDGKINSCPFCANQMVSVTNSLAIRFPEIAKEWHPTKNGNLTPEKIIAGSNKKVWWKCDKGPDHEWQTRILHRTGKSKSGCPFCANKKVSVTNSLAALFPEIAKEWHPIKNGKLTPDDVTSGSGKKVWWKCNKGSDHEWEETITNRTRGNNCPFCSRHQVSITNSLASLYPELAKEWHPIKNGDLTPKDITSKSGKKVWWKCNKGPDHEWFTSPGARFNNKDELSGCPFCANQMVSITNSLASLYPEIAKEWHPIKNRILTPDKIVAGSNKYAWWKCSKGPDHEWKAKICDRTKQEKPTGCPYCAGQKLSITNSLASCFPHFAKQWHPTKNCNLTPDKIVAGSTEIVWWKCDKGPDHEWKSPVFQRTRKKKPSMCPFCSNRRVSITNSLATLFPEIAKEWHPTKNGNLTPNDLVATSMEKIWWKCKVNSDHIWKAAVLDRTKEEKATGCPICNTGWTVDSIRLFVKSLINHLDSMTAAEMYTLFIQNGLYNTTGKSRGFIKSLATKRFPVEELKEFIKEKNSLVDEFISNPEKTLVDLHEEEDYQLILKEENDLADISDEKLLYIKTKNVLEFLDSDLIISSDIEAVEFFLSSAKAKIWKHVFNNEEEAVQQAKNFNGDIYAEQVRKEFLQEYKSAKELVIPKGYNFKLNGEITHPNLMQRLIASNIRKNSRIGNWSGTGAGKTLSAILSSRVINAKFTLVFCPNSVVKGWREAILSIYPNSVVAVKNFNPNWKKIIEKEREQNGKFHYRYLIINYEMFQQKDSVTKVRKLLENEIIDFIVIDEIQFVKQRNYEKISKRKKIIGALISKVEQQNSSLSVLGMSATPVINNLIEGKSLVEMITGEIQNDLQTKATITNCMRLHQKLVNLGFRYVPQYETQFKKEIVEVDCSDYLDEIIRYAEKGSPLSLEKILTKARLPIILDNLEPKTLIYTEYVDEIVDFLKEEISKAGWKVDEYTGDKKSGLYSFIEGDTDILIGSSAIKVGVDGLQQVCSKLIMNALPWTNADFEQIKGRIYRQGQVKNVVKMIIPITYAIVNDNRWSWCESRLQRLHYKKSIADAAVDGVVPEGHLRTPAQAYRDLMGWLERLRKGDIDLIEKRKINIPFPEELDSQIRKNRIGKFGEFSQMNRRWNNSKSITTYQRLEKNPEEWEHYHTLYREARIDWEIVPYEEMIKWFDQREGYSIGDFGCGEAKIAEALSDKHTIYSFDYIAINDNVIAGDMSNVPLEDEELDAAIFSLSLMGTNTEDYIEEAHRTLKLDGYLHIIESTSRFSDIENFTKQLENFGFKTIEVSNLWKFTQIYAIKISRIIKKSKLIL